MKGLPTASHRAVVLIYALLFGVFLLVSDVFVYKQQKQLIEDGFRQDHETALELISMLGREAMLSENYALIDWFVESWGQAHQDFAYIQVESDSGFLLADFRNPNASGEILAIERPVALTHRRLFTLRAGITTQSVVQQLENLTAQLATTSLALTLVLSLLVWSLFQRLAIRPLEREVRRRVEAEKGIEEQREFLQSVIDGVNDGIMVIDNNYEVLLSNRVAKQTGDMSYAADPAHPKCYELSHHQDHPCSGDHHPCPLREVERSKKPTSVVHNHPDADGSPRYFELAATPLLNEDGEYQGIIESSRDLTTHLRLRDQLEEEQEHLKFLAHHDMLTELPNRLLLIDRLQRAILSCEREGSQLALLFIDLDNFKQINDSYGHDVGDQVLIEVSKRLVDAVRKSDTVARLGGDEFNIALSGIRDETQMAEIAKNIIARVRAPCHVAGDDYVLTCSIGISLYPQDANTPNDLMRNADTAMFRAKEAGRNKFEFYTEDMTIEAQQRAVLEKQLRTAIERDELEVYYQPQFQLSTGEPVGCEALVRWRHADRGLLQPRAFLSVAESTGLIVDIGEWILRRACRQISEWRRAGVVKTRVAVNLSGKQLRQQDLVDLVDSVLKDTGCEPAWLELEVTEGFVMDHPEVSIRALADIHDLGVSIAIDDFGTGHSSLAYLKQLPIDKLKIDRSFVRDLPDDSEDAAIAQAIIALGNSMGLTLVAEGVETEAQRLYLLEAGCEQAQGYLFSVPVSHEDLPGLLVSYQPTKKAGSQLG